MSPVTAPRAPGALGQAGTPQEMLVYLDELGQWITQRRAEIEEVDAFSRSQGRDQDALPDIRLALSLWQAVVSRQAQLMQLWDSGRVGQLQLEQLSQLIWGRLDTPAMAAGVGAGDLRGASLPEATRLSDALIATLRGRLRLDPQGTRVQARTRELQAALERLRDQVALEAGSEADVARAQLAELETRLSDLEAKADRGGDVGGLLGPLEAEAATLERDLIVGAAQRRERRLSSEQAAATRTELIARSDRVRELAEQVAGAVSPPPRYAVPDVTALGAVPPGGVQLTNYSHALEQVSAALDQVEKANRQALDTLQAARAELDHERAGSPDPVSSHLLDAVAGLLELHPVPIEAVGSSLAALQYYQRWQEGR